MNNFLFAASVRRLTKLPPQVCIDGNAEIAEILLRAGPNINAPDNDGWTPLHAAAQCGYTDLARYVFFISIGNFERLPSS